MISIITKLIKLSKRFIFYFIKFLRHRRYTFTIPVARLLGRFIQLIPKTERTEIIYPYDYKNRRIESVSNLRKTGIVISSFTNQGSINSFISLQKELEIYENLAEEQKPSPFTDVSDEEQNKNFLRIITKHFSTKYLLSIAYDPEIIQTVYSYFGLFPSVYKINVWHNERVSDNPSSTQFFHRDPEDKYLLKLFIPLRVISAENGPFQFISTSHKRFLEEEFTQVMAHRSATKERVKLEKKIEKNYKDKIISFTGEPYNYCLADTNGLHRGLLPIKGKRFLINVVYCSSFPHINKPLPKIYNPFI